MVQIDKFSLIDHNGQIRFNTLTLEKTYISKLAPTMPRTTKNIGLDLDFPLSEPKLALTLVFSSLTLERPTHQILDS